jgi:MFS family permease
MLRRGGLGRLLGVDFLYWLAFAMFQTTFALFGERRFGFGLAQTGYLMSGFGLLGVFVQVGLIGRAVAAYGERRVLVAGLAFAALGIGLASASRSVTMFVVALVPVALGMGFCNPTLASLLSRSADPSDQGKVQGTAGALESLGRTIGPVMGNGLLQQAGEGSAYASASALIVLTLALATFGGGLSVPEPPGQAPAE